MLRYLETLADALAFGYVVALVLIGYAAACILPERQP
jgi:hypothetical protein